MKSKVLTIDHLAVTRAFSMMLLAVSLLLIFAYVGLVNQTILKIVAWQKTEKSIATLAPTLSGIEAQYISLQKGITLQRAAALNFREAVNPEFISRSPMGKGLSVRGSI
jgi:hypothetical protein